MWLLGQKDNKLWWKEYDPLRKDYIFVSEEINTAYWEKEKEIFESIAAKVFNDAFNRDTQK